MYTGMWREFVCSRMGINVELDDDFHFYLFAILLLVLSFPRRRPGCWTGL